MWERRGGEIPETWYRLPVFYFSNVSEIRGPDEPVWCAGGVGELDYELEVAALVDTPACDLPRTAARRRSAATRSSTTGRPATSSARRRSVRLGPAKGKDFASSIGPWLVTPDELADARAAARPARTSR